MALATYSDLQALVADYLVRSDLTSQIVDAIMLCESRIHYGAGSMTPFPSPPLRIRAMEASIDIIAGQSQTGGTSAGSANAQTVALAGYTLLTGRLVTFPVGTSLTNTGATTLNIQSTGAKSVVQAPDSAAFTGGEFVASTNATVYYDGTNYVKLTGPGFPLPSRFLAERRMYIDASPVRVPNFIASMDFWARWLGSTQGTPLSYTIEADTVVLGPAPNADQKIKFLYWKKFAALSGTQTTNWLLTNKPDIYLYGTLLEMQRFQNNLPELPNWREWHQLYMSAVRGLQDQNEIDRYGAGPLQMRSDVSPTDSWGMMRQA
jgi:hypothetical protein